MSGNARMATVSTLTAVVLAGVLVCGMAAGAQRTELPAMPPTVAALPAGTAGPVDAGHKSRRAEIDYRDGLLRITANNSSLNQILREVGRQTGMKITGGVQDGPVFGTYGPAPASQVIYSLLDGAASNVLIVDDPGSGPAELILTPRLGGPSPPNPNAAQADGEVDVAPDQAIPVQMQRRPSTPQTVLTGPPNLNGLPASNGGQTGTPINGGADLGTTPGAFIPAGLTPPDATAQIGVQSTAPAATTIPADPSEPQSPNGTSTPQQIYEQLMKLRQQQQTTPH